MEVPKTVSFLLFWGKSHSLTEKFYKFASIRFMQTLIYIFMQSPSLLRTGDEEETKTICHILDKKCGFY